MAKKSVHLATWAKITQILVKSKERRKFGMSTFICLALLIISVITNDTTVLLASGLFAIAAEISVAFDRER